MNYRPEKQPVRSGPRFYPLLPVGSLREIRRHNVLRSVRTKCCTAIGANLFRTCCRCLGVPSIRLDTPPKRPPFAAKPRPVCSLIVENSLVQIPDQVIDLACCGDEAGAPKCGGCRPPVLLYVSLVEEVIGNESTLRPSQGGDRRICTTPGVALSSGGSPQIPSP